MARTMTDIENDIQGLSDDQKRELLLTLVAEVEISPDAELEELIKEFVTSVDRTSRAVDTVLARLERFDEEIERGRVTVRDAVRRSGEAWPFALPQLPTAQ